MIYKNVNGTQKLVTNIRKPKKYQRLEYIQSSGTQYINTGIKPNQETKVEMRASMLSTSGTPHFIYSQGSGSGTGRYGFMCEAGASRRLRFDFGSNMQQFNSRTLPVGQIFDFVSYKGISVDGVSYSSNLTNVFSNNYPLTIFIPNYKGSISSYAASMRLYSCKIYNTDTLLKSFIPCKYKGQIGLWDEAHSKFYGNSGTGTFTAGPALEPEYDEVEKVLIPNTLLPQGVELYDYIESSGTQYIHIPNNSSTIKVKLNFSLTQRNTTQDTIMSLNGNQYYWQQSSGNLRVWNSNGSAGSTNYTVNTRVWVTGEITSTNTTIQVNSNTVGSTNKVADGTGIYLFTYKTVNYSASARMYTCQILENNIITHNLLPCTYFGEPGMWDTVTKQFYKNQGTGQFILGNKIILREYEYLQSDQGAYIDTGFKPNQDSRVLANILLLNRNLTAVFGTRNNSAWPHGAFVLWNGPSLYYQYGDVVYSTYKLSDPIVNEPITIDLNKNVGTVNNSPVTCNTATFQTNYPFLIGNIHTASDIDPRPTPMKVYSFKMYDNGILIRDFKPCLYNGEAGLWDSVECKFYGNANSSGTFTLGRQVSGEIPIWVQKNALTNSTIGAYINTGVFFDSTKNYIFETKFKTSTASKRYIVLGSYDGTPQINFEIYNDNKLRLWANSEVDKSIAVSANQDHTLRIEYIAGGTWNVTLDNISKTFTKEVSGTNSKNFRMFCDHRSSSWTTFNNPITYYYMYIYENGEMIRKLVPATMGGRPGLYDKVNHKMYFNANSSGNFTVE